MRRTLRTTTGVIVLMVASLGSAAVAQRGNRTIRVNIGTAAPENSIWYDILEQTAQDWGRISDGRVEVNIFPGAILGDEATMLNRVRGNTQLNAVGLSGGGLALVDKAITAVEVPMMIESYDELDYIWERMVDEIEGRLEAQGLVALNWSDVGWIRFFTKEPARTPDDIRAAKLFVSAGDDDAVELYRDLGMTPVPSGVDDLVINLQTGLIEGFGVPPLFALANQSFAVAPHMLDLEFTILRGATLINRETWNRIPADLRPALRDAAREAAESRKDEIRRMDETAIQAMQDKGLELTPVDAELLARWREEVEATWETLRGRMVPEDLFDEALRLRDEFRAQR